MSARTLQGFQAHSLKYSSRQTVPCLTVILLSKKVCDAPSLAICEKSCCPSAVVTNGRIGRVRVRVDSLQSFNVHKCAISSIYWYLFGTASTQINTQCMVHSAQTHISCLTVSFKSIFQHVRIN